MKKLLTIILVLFSTITFSQETITAGMTGLQLRNALNNNFGFLYDSLIYLSSNVDRSNTNELQVLSISNDTIYLRDGGFVKLPTTTSFDGQYSSLSGAPTVLSAFTNDVGYLTSFTEVDGSVTNELQLLSISNDTIYLSNGGFAKLPAVSTFSGSYADLSNVPSTFPPDPHNQAWSTISSTPTSLSGYGISDAFNGDYNNLTNKPILFSGSYNDLSDKPTLFNGSYNDLTNKPTLFDGDYNSLSNVPTFATIATSGSFSDLSNTPTTLNGYGITDALVNTHPASNVTTTLITNWDSAYGWGDHSVVGYVTGTPWVSEGYLTSEVDGSTTNEIQALSISNDTISLTSGGFVKIPMSSGYISLGIITTRIPETPGSSGAVSDSTYYTLPTFSGTTYYIDPGFITNGNGSESNPYNTLSGVTLQNNAKYLFKRATVYTLSLPTVNDINVMFGAYGDTTLAKPKISVNTTNPVLTLNGNNIFLIKDLELYSANRGGLGIRHNGAGTAWVYNCDIHGGTHNYWKYGPTTSQGTVKLLYSSFYDAWTDNMYGDDIMELEIGHCHFYDCNMAYFTYPGDDGANAAPGDNIQLATAYGSLTFNIYKSILDHSSTGHKFCFIAWNGYTPTDNAWNNMNGNFSDNIVIGSRSQGFLGSNGCIYLGDNQDGDTITFERNIITDGSFGIFGESTNIKAAYNVIYNVGTGISLSQNGADAVVHNNTLQNFTNAGIGAVSGTSVSSFNNVYSSATGYAYNTNATYESDYNLFDGYVTGGSTTLAMWQSSTIYDDNSISGDPLFNSVATGNFRPLTGSPVLDSGIDLGYSLDQSADVVTSPPSMGAYENVDPPENWGYIPGTPDTIYIDSVLVVDKFPIIFGDTTGKYAEFRDGDLYFKNGADLKLNWQNIPIASGSEYEIQFSNGNLLTSDEDFLYKPDSSLLVAPNIRTGVLRFNDGTVMTTAASSPAFTPGDNNVSKLSIMVGDALSDTLTPDYLYIDTDYFIDTLLTISVPERYNLESFQARANATLSSLVISNDYGDISTIISPAVGITYKQTIASSPESDSIYITASGNSGDGTRVLLKLERNYLYVAPPTIATNPPFFDGATALWVASDTADYYQLNEGNFEILFDKIANKTLGSELIDPIDFTLSSWTKTAAVTAHTATTLTTSAAGGAYRLFQPPDALIRAVYMFDFEGTVSDGSTIFYNSNNTTYPLVTMNGDPGYFAAAGGYMYIRNNTAATSEITSISWKRVNGYNFGQSYVTRRPGFSDGAITFDGSQWLRMATSPTVTYQKVFLVGRKGTGDYYVYESLTDFGVDNSGVITLGATSESTPTTYYDVDIKEVIFRNEDNPENDSLFREYLKAKYSVVEN